MISLVELQEICKLTLELTRLRQNECKHLCVENTAVEIFGGLLDRLAEHKKENTNDQDQ